MPPNTDQRVAALEMKLDRVLDALERLSKPNAPPVGLEPPVAGAPPDRAMEPTHLKPVAALPPPTAPGPVEVDPGPVLKPAPPPPAPTGLEPEEFNPPPPNLPQPHNPIVGPDRRPPLVERLGSLRSRCIKFSSDWSGWRGG